MKLTLFLIAFTTVVVSYCQAADSSAAAVSIDGYKYNKPAVEPRPAHTQTSEGYKYKVPGKSVEPEPAHTLNPDGYRYKSPSEQKPTEIKVPTTTISSTKKPATKITGGYQYPVPATKTQDKISTTTEHQKSSTVKPKRVATTKQILKVSEIQQVTQKIIRQKNQNGYHYPAPTPTPRSPEGYKYPVPSVSLPSVVKKVDGYKYPAPTTSAPEPAHVKGSDGYKYKTPTKTFEAELPEPTHVKGPDGYKYKVPVKSLEAEPILH